MGSRINTLSLVAFACGVLAAAHSEPASAQPTETGFKGLVRVRVVSDYSSGGPVAGLDRQTVWYGFDPGESMGFLVTAGHNGNLCRTGASGPFPGSSPDSKTRTYQEASAQYVWNIDIRMIDVQASSMNFELSWQRTSRAAPDERLQYSHRMTLRQGESRAVDLLHAVPGSECFGVTILVEADIIDDPSLEGRIVEWDLWASVGSTTAPRQKFRSVQGAPAEFKFDPLTIPASAESANLRYVLLSGTVTGRLRLDGNIELAIDVRRMSAQTVSRPELIAMTLRTMRQRGSDPTFRKNFTAKPGETVKIVLPRNMVSQVTSTGPVTGRPIFNSVPEAFETSITVQARVR